MAGEWVFICMCVHVEGGEREEGKVLKKREGALRERSESSDVSMDLLNAGTFTPFDVLLSSSGLSESKLKFIVFD